MARSPRWRVFSWLPIRRGASGTTGMAAALMVALLVAAMPGSPGVAAVRAQLVATAEPSVTVHGTGEASAPAVSATVQLLIGQGGRGFGFSQDGSGGSSFSSGSSEPMSDSGFVSEIAPEATPGGSKEAIAAPAATPEGRRNRRERSGPEPFTPERLAPVIAAVTTAAGIAPEAVSIDLSPLATEPYGGRQESARLDFEIAQPEPDALNELIAAASDAAAANGMVIEVAGVLYNPADCAVVEQEATEAAIADARAQADRLAGLLGVTLGEVVGISSDPYFSIGLEEGGCSGQRSSFYDSGYGGLGITVPVFDPSNPAAVEVYTLLTISYEIVGE